jgi:hypothetical protein
MEHRALTDPGRGGDLFHGDLLGPVPGEQLLGRPQDGAAVACRVSAFATLLDHRLLFHVDNWTSGQVRSHRT